jgi:hypothetical protein
MNKPFFQGFIGRDAMNRVSTFLLLISLIFTGCHKKVTPVEYVLPDTVQLQSGDLAFRTGISKESRAVTTLDRNSIYTHVGMVVWTDDGWRVLHAVPNERASKQEEDSVKLEPIGTFFRSDRAEKGGIYRYPLTPKDTQQLREHALALYARHPLFDNLFDVQDTIAFYCTELVYFLYLQELQIDLSEGRRHNLPLYPDLIFCTDVSRNSKLQEVWSFH